MRILTIGGTGILGRALVAEASAAGHFVATVSDTCALEADSRFYAHAICSRDDREGLRSAVDSFGVARWDLVVDMLCYVPEHAQSLLHAVDGASACTVVISTTMVYDWSQPLPWTPKHRVGTPGQLGVYAAGKSMAESSWLDAFERQGHPVTILRLPHVVGRGCELGPVPLHNRDRSALRRLRENKELWLIGGGDQRIQIVDAHDVATVILGVPGSSKAAGQVYNCANPDVLTAREYWQLVADFVGVTLRVRPVPEVDLTGCGWGWALTALPRVVDMESLAQDVGVVPCTPVASSLHACVRWLDEHPAGWGRDVISELSDREPPRTRAEWHDALRTAAVHRGRSDVDARMNLGWNASVAPGLAAERKRCK